MRVFHISLFFSIILNFHSLAQTTFFDPSFGVGGKSGISLTGVGSGSFEAIKVQSDQKIVVVGRIPGNGSVFRFKDDGALDTSFSSGGVYSFASSGVILRDVDIQGDGKIVAAGELNDSFFVMRLQPTGTPDAGFGTGGAATLGFGSFTDAHGKSVTIQTDGKIVMSGECASANMGFARFNTDGSPDVAFGTGGFVIGPYGRANSVSMTGDGKIVGGGNATSSMAYALMVTRYLSNGTLDTFFNHTGITYTVAGAPGSNFGRAVGVQPDGKILLAGSGSFGSENGNFVVVRYNTNGTLDGAFGAGGIATVDFSGEDDDCWDMSILADGKILLTGTSGAHEHTKLAVARLNNNGTVDNTFGASGRIVNLIGIRAVYARSTAVPSSGKIVVAGNTIRNMTDPYTDPVIIRYLASGSQVPPVTAPDFRTMFYPNPAKHFLYIKPDMANRFPNVEVFDITGREILKKDFGTEYFIDVSNLSGGHYFCKFISADGTLYVTQITIQN